MTGEREPWFWFRWVAIGIAVTIGVILTFQNVGSIPIHLFFWTVQSSLVLFTVVIALLGFAAGWLVGHR